MSKKNKKNQQENSLQNEVSDSHTEERTEQSSEEKLSGINNTKDPSLGDPSLGDPSFNDPLQPSGSSIPLPEYEENSMSARKADLLSKVNREIADWEPGQQTEDIYEDSEYPEDNDLEEFFLEENDTDSVPKEKKEKKKKKKNNARSKNNSSAMIWILSAAVIVLLACLLIFFLGDRKKPDSNENNMSTVSGESVAEQSTVSADTVAIAEAPLEKDAYEDVNALVTAYFKARETNDLESYSEMRSYTDSLEKAKLEAKSEYIEGYRNIHCYTKIGPYENSYMVYVSYDLKLKEWEQTVPALETLVVCRKEVENPEVSENSSEEESAPETELYVYTGSFDDNVVEYIKTVTAQEDVTDLFKHVDTAYQEIMDADPAYEEYMASLKQLIRDGVGVRLAEAVSNENEETQSKTEEESASENSASENSVSGNITEEETEENKEKETAPAEFEVEATTYVNVRVSDSEQADRMGSVNPGTKLTCKEQLANGWSHVIFEGKDAYIKSDYLVVVGGDDVKTNGKVSVTSTVNIRSKADIDSEKLGSAFTGTSYDLIEYDEDGWTSILYNGKIAYIKSEYVKVE